MFGDLLYRLGSVSFDILVFAVVCSCFVGTVCVSYGLLTFGLVCWRSVLFDGGWSDVLVFPLGCLCFVWCVGVEMVSWCVESLVGVSAGLEMCLGFVVVLFGLF